MLVLLVIISYSTTCVRGYAHFRTEIPSGMRVPHPCKPNYIWHGVGHWTAQGGSDRNPFGVDFYDNGKKWDNVLCNKDSDGDGKTNGQELGDPTCAWTKGSGSLGTAISHPGICEPTNSTVCKVVNQNKELCTYDDIQCDFPLDVPEIGTFSLAIEDSVVPAEETTYYCQFFDLPDPDYHIVAYKPNIVNRNVVHHIDLYACVNDAERRNYEQPGLCNGMQESCLNLITGWTLGDPGQCFPNNTGYLIGNSSVKYVMLQIHWNNPEKKAGYTDSSGLTFFYTPKLRANNIATLTMGQYYLNIPPGKNAHTEYSTVSSTCSSAALTDAVHIIAANIHMHLLGARGNIDHYRNGTKVNAIARDPVFQYDSPIYHQLAPPLQFLPGDEIRMKCTYNSMSRKTTTYYGDGTQEEMCYGFLIYYPSNSKFNLAIDYKDVDLCEAEIPQNGGAPGYPGGIGNGCNAMDYIELEEAPLLNNIKNNCHNLTNQCTADCRAARKAFSDHPCTKGTQYGIIVNYIQHENITDTDAWKRVEELCKTVGDISNGRSAVPVVEVLPVTIGLSLVVIGLGHHGIFY